MYLPLKMHYYNILPQTKQTMPVIYGDNLLHHSQSFRIMVKGWKWDPRIWYDLLYNWPSTHKISCKYLHADQSYDGMHLLPHWTTLYVMHERHAFECSVAAILKILNGGYHKDHVIYPHICYDLLHTWSPIHKFSCKYSHVDQSYNNFIFLVAGHFEKN